MPRCNHDDCFTCPYDDCISNHAPRGGRSKRRKLTKEEIRRHKAEANKKYYLKHQEAVSATHRNWYLRKKKNKGDNGTSDRNITGGGNGTD